LSEQIKVTNLIVFKPISRYYNQGRRGKRDVIEPQLLQELISLRADILTLSIACPLDNEKPLFGAETQTI
jgi:hypothetical protein